ncbi:hypothetical protein K501DRAFT_270864 [Backusella circina FSU 941]|nr:hypothetical protein K501DRAFT_270864 [Backusella circina FSU 941]
MEKLPVEILNQIFIRLHQQHRAECMTVCRLWATIIAGTCLFHTIRVGSMKQMKKLIDRVREDPSQGARVERLILDLFIEADFDMDIIPPLFPNVRVFFMSQACDLPFSEKLTPHPWCKSIEYIGECLKGVHVQQILTSGTCPRLKNIAVYGDYGRSRRNFIELMANAPALTTLNISGFQFSLLDLESLHTKLPLLRSLTLESIEIDCSILPSKIQTTPSMRILNIDTTSMLKGEEEVNLFQYITTKYTQLLELSFDKMLGSTMSNAVIKKSLNNNTSTAFMEQLGSKLEAISLGSGRQDLNPFEMLDDGVLLIRKIGADKPLLQQITRLNIARCVHTLTVNHLNHCIDLGWLKEFSVLKELTLFNIGGELSRRRRMIKPSDLLKNLGESIEILHLCGLKLTNDFSVVHQHPLKSISFENVTLAPQLDGFISQSFPKLHTLIFEFCHIGGRSLILPNIDLSYFRIIEKLPISDTAMLVISLNNNERTWYFANPKIDISFCTDYFSYADTSVYPAITSLPYDKYSGTPYMTLACNSLNNFFMINSVY